MSEGAQASRDDPGTNIGDRFHQVLPGLLPIAIGILDWLGAWSIFGNIRPPGAPVLLFGFLPVPIYVAQVSQIGTFLGVAGLVFVLGGAIIIWRQTAVPNARDYYGGLALMALAQFALWASNDLPGMHGFAFGPGTAPRLFAGILLVLGAGVALVGLFSEGPSLERYAFRGPLFVTASMIVFGVTIRHLGLVIATYISILVAALGSSESRWIETIIWAAALTVFCALLFPYGLNLPMPLWPQNLTLANIFSIR